MNLHEFYRDLSLKHKKYLLLPTNNLNTHRTTAFFVKKCHSDAAFVMQTDQIVQESGMETAAVIARQFTSSPPYVNIDYMVFEVAKILTHQSN